MLQLTHNASDVRKLFELLQGQHRRDRSERVIVAMMAAVFVGMPCFFIATLDGHAWTRNATVAALFAVVALLSVAAVLADAYGVVTVTPDRIEYRTLLRSLNWTVEAAQVHSLHLAWDRVWVLSIVPATGKMRRVQLTRTMQQQLATLYPELVESERLLPAWMKRAAWAALALAVAGMLAVIWYVNGV